jgi:S-formylglutathione hydrolase FrmB
MAAVASCSGAATQSPHSSSSWDTSATPSGSALATLPPRVTKRSFVSASLGVSKDYYVYKPPGYDANPTQRWPVLYLLHGMTQDETAWPLQGQLASAADAAHFGAIVIMPDGDNSYYSNSTTPVNYSACMAKGTGLLDPRATHDKTCVRTPNYETYIVDDLLHEIDRNYRTIADRNARGIAGLSMGGFGAFMLAMRHPETFSAAASHSGVLTLLFAGPYPYRRGDVRLLDDVSQWGAEIGVFGAWFRGIFGADRNNWLAHDPSELAKTLVPAPPPSAGLALYLDCGTDDEFALHNGARYLHDILTDRGIAHEFFVGPGAHNFAFWKSRLPFSLSFFAKHFANARVAHPGLHQAGSSQ